MNSTKKFSASIDSDLYETFEKLREEFGESNRSQEIQKALEIRISQWKKQKLEEQCKQVTEEKGSLVEKTYELQGEALQSKFDR